MSQPLIVAIDFDDTISPKEEDLIPRRLMPGAKDAINWMHSLGCYIIVWTCRVGMLAEILEPFMKKEGVRFHVVNENAPFYPLPTSRKIYADVYIDNRNVFGFDNIDWEEVRRVVARLHMDKIIKDLQNRDT